MFKNSAFWGAWLAHSVGHVILGGCQFEPQFGQKILKKKEIVLFNSLESVVNFNQVSNWEADSFKSFKRDVTMSKDP